MGISNLSLSLSHEYHHAYSLQLTNGKDGSKQHSLESIEEAYYLAEEMMFVFPCRFGVLCQISDVTNIYACTTISDVTISDVTSSTSTSRLPNFSSSLDTSVLYCTTAISLNISYYVAPRHKFCLTDLTVSKFARKYDVLF
jgi:hypothetical protein